MVKFLDPRAATSTEMEPYELARDIRAGEGEGITVGLLANGFPDSELFLGKLASALKSRLANLETKIWNKGNASVAASETMLAEIKANCQVAIAAYGH